ncbi:hypothetical protein ACWCPJ_37265 [Streptomyces collinus]
MDHSARITAFTGLVGPPPGPAPAVDWALVEGWLGTRLPPDFVALDGAGNWSWWLDMSALNRPRDQGLAATVEGMLDGYRQLRAAHPQYYPMPAWPEPGGFLPFASTIDGDQIGWCADGPPETWRVAVNPRHSDQEPPLPGDVGTVAQVLGGGGDTAGPGTHEEPCPSLMDGMKELVAVEGRVGQQEHRLSQGTQKPLGVLPRTPVRRRR